MATAIPVSRVMSRLQLNVRITGLPTLKARAWLATRLMMTAAWILGTKIEISIDSGAAFDERRGVDVEGKYRNFEWVGDFVAPRCASIEPTSPLFDPTWHEWGPHVTVHLNGEPLDLVISYDIDAGCVRVYRKDDEGNVVLENGAAVTEVRRGRVDLRPRPD